jgi:hypothetical protein
VDTDRHSFDALARELAGGTVSRRRALTFFLAALVSTLNIPKAEAKKRKKHHHKRTRVVVVSPPCGSTAQCPQGTTCINGGCCEFAKACGSGKSATCCKDGQLCCNDTCIEQSNSNCGSCANACQTSQLLGIAQCCCNGVCINNCSTPQMCGGCNSVCSSPCLCLSTIDGSYACVPPEFLPCSPEIPCTSNTECPSGTRCLGLFSGACVPLCGGACP